MIDIIKLMIEADVPLLLWGAPGTGKTAAVAALAAERGSHVEVLIGSTLDPTDLGRPIVTDNDEVVLAPPTWAERIRKALKAKKETWLFLDELTCSPPSVQAALLRVVNERQVADVSIEGCHIIAASNPADQATDSSDLSHASANRWAHVDWEVDVEAWCAGELAGWGHPDEALSEIRALITGWISYRSDALLSPPKAHSDDVRGWPSPRAWSHLIRALGTPERIRTPLGRQVCGALVGSGAAAELIAWSLDNDLPNAVDLLDNKVKLPTRGDRASLAVSACISYAVTHVDRVPDLWRVCLAQRDDLSLVSARRAINTLDTAKIEYKHTEDLEKLVTLVCELS